MFTASPPIAGFAPELEPAMAGGRTRQPHRVGPTVIERVRGELTALCPRFPVHG